MYIFNVIIYDKAAILVPFQITMQNMELSRDLGHALGQGYESICL